MPKGAFERTGARMGARLDRMMKLSLVRRAGRIGGRTLVVVVLLVMAVFWAAIGGMLAVLLQAVLRAIGVIGPQEDNATGSWFVYGAAIMGAYVMLVMLVHMVREYLEERLYNREAAIDPSAGKASVDDVLTCPRCESFLPDGGVYTNTPHHARHQRATCEGCGAHLVRHPELDADGWIIERTAEASED